MIHSANKTEIIARLRAVIKEQPTDAPTICARLGISQPGFSRLWKAAGADIIRFGAARATQYGMAREIRNVGSVLPVFEVRPDGSSLPFGELRVLHNDWYVFSPASGAIPQVMQGLPYWLQDLRPQGFLGRLIPLINRDLNLPPNILAWSDDDTLHFLSRRGEEVPGNIIVGNESYRRFLCSNSPAGVVMAQARSNAYATLAELANQGEAPGSSAGGEQPKFTAVVQRDDGRIDHVIVKFSALLATEAGRRWGDLLVAEHLALETLRQFGVAASQSEIVMTQNRVYLEVVRFDRHSCAGLGSGLDSGLDSGTGTNIRGRAAIVSMAGVDGLLGALDKNWTHSTMLLRDQGLLSMSDWACVRLLDVYGALIGNSDRHPGNLSLSWQPDGRFALAPVYDMLPMMYQPNRQGEVVERGFDMAQLDRLDLRALPEARRMALSFWARVREDARISVEFKQVAERHAAIIAHTN